MVTLCISIMFSCKKSSKKHIFLPNRNLLKHSVHCTVYSVHYTLVWFALQVQSDYRNLSMSLHNIAFLTLQLWDRATSPNTKLCVHPLYIQRNPVNLTLQVEILKLEKDLFLAWHNYLQIYVHCTYILIILLIMEHGDMELQQYKLKYTASGFFVIPSCTSKLRYYRKYNIQVI